MKKLVKRFFFERNRWEILKYFFKPFYHIYYDGELISERRKKEKELMSVRDLFKDKTVRNGIFKGLVYPDFKACGSALYPKLIGSYEKELEIVFENIRHKKYTEIIDVGCAEGYYAVGLAKMFPQATVFAYDIDPVSRDQCKKLSHINGVESRVNINERCEEITLKEFNFTGTSLILSDCEGYELSLFTKQNVGNLAKSDILIEVHDSDSNDIFSYLIDCFKDTHNYSVIKSIGDLEKIRTYNYPEIESLDRKTKYEVLKENREASQNWLFFVPIE